ncbi:regulatory protein RecX [Aliidiomarina halalkaliphila]|nr:regulatory protein RecX [Aliidiomarina halalkaliphila]
MRPSPIDPEDEQVIEARAVQLLSRREHSIFELRMKLQQKGFDRAAINRVLEKLEERNWQSDARFADVFYRQRVMQGYGPLRVRQEMQLKGVHDDDIERCFTTYATDWAALAYERYRRRFGNAPLAPSDHKERARRMRFLAQRGFTSEHIYRAFEKAQENPED